MPANYPCPHGHTRETWGCYGCIWSVRATETRRAFDAACGGRGPNDGEVRAVLTGHNVLLWLNYEGALKDPANIPDEADLGHACDAHLAALTSYARACSEARKGEG